MRAPAALVMVAIAVLCECGCTTASGVAEFASESQKALAKGPAILADIEGSCLRRQTADLRMTDFRSTPDAVQQACAEFAPEQKSLLVASRVLSDYFAALTQLSSAGSATIGKDAGQMASGAGNLSGLSSAGSDAIGGLAMLLTRMAADHYQHRRLSADLRKADSSIAVVTGELARIVEADYMQNMLVKEQQAFTRRYETFAEDNPGPVVTLLLQERWTNDVQRLKARRNLAQAYVAALKSVASGHAALAAHAGDKSIKDIPGLLKPYAVSLEALNASM